MKFKSKSLISIILSIMMVISMILVGIPANAVVIDSNNSVGADTKYYLWYKIADDIDYNTFKQKVEMRKDGDNYVASFEDTSLIGGTTFVCYINTDPSNITTGLSTLNKSTTGTYDRTYFGWLNVGEGQQKDNYYYIKSKVNSTFKVKVTYDPVNNKVHLTRDDGTTSTQCTVTFDTVGTGSGNVTAVKTADSSKINSGDKVDNNTNVRFTANANSGSTFAGWFSNAECTTEIEGANQENPVYEKSITADTNVYAKFTVNSSSTHNVTVGTHENGDVKLVSTTPAAKDTKFEFKVKAGTGYAIDSVSLAGTDNTVTTGTIDDDGYTHFTFIMPNADVTINATFKAIKYYYSSNYDGSNHFVEMQPDSKNPGSYVVHVKYDNNYKNQTDVGYLNESKKFKIANVDNDSDNKLDSAEYCVNFNIEPNTVERSDSLLGVTFSYNNSWKDLYINGTSLTEFYIQYTPGGTNGLAGTIKVWSVADYEGTVPPQTYTINKGYVDAAKGDFEFTVDGASATSAVKDATVTVKVTPNGGYKCTGITVTKSSGVEIANINDNGNGTYSFTMPGENVTVTPTIVSSGGSEGTLSDQYFLISNVDNPSNWTESMFHQAKKDSDGKYYITITPAEIKALAGAYNSNVYFTMASAKSVDKIYFQDSNSPHATTTDSSLISVEDKVNSGKKFCRFSIILSSVISVTISYDNNNTFSVIPESSKIDSSVEVIAKDATIRTDGLQSTLHTYGNTYFYTVGSDGSKTYYTEGTTLIENKMLFTRESQKSVAAVSLDEVKKGTTLHIETQEVKSGYYVAGYVVNGETVALFNPGDTPVLDYTIPYDTEANTKIEITPVYFATDSSNCVTFYVEGFDSTVQDTWGNTIACYPYYSGVADSDNAFSCYPGQPMLYKDGKYFIQIPRKFNDKKVVGMTLNNYKWDDVHGSINTLANAQTYDYDDFVRIADKQENGTYIVDNIIFSFKFRTNWNNFGYKTGDSKVSPSTISYETFDAGNGWENLTDHNGNLVSIFGTQLFKTTDPQYSEKSKIEDNPTGNEHLLIVSNGYDENYQGYYATEWTIYAYKDNAYTKLAQIPSSALVLSYEEVADSTEVSKDGTYTYKSQLSSYSDAYTALNIDKYKNLPAYITYEQNDEQSNSNDGSGTNKGFRCDGRWYYSRINEDIISNVKIQYADSLISDFTDDQFVTDTNKGTTTQANAYFTNPTSYGNTTCEGKIGQGNFDITTTYSGSEYMFVGWYLEKEGVTTKITNSTNASIEMTGSETYVARYVKIPTSSINISHSLFSNVSETAAKGAGTLGLQVTLSYDDGKNVFSKPYAYNTSDSSVSTNVIMADVQSFYNSVSNSVGESNLDISSFSIKVSLTSIPADKTSLKNAYVEDYTNENVSYLSFSTDSSTISNNLNWIAPSVGESMEVSIPFNKIFNNSTPITNYVEFFSEFETNRVNYEITYNFKTRLYGEKQYKSNGTVSVGEEGLISANGTYSFTNAYIMSVAPDESNFMKEFNWDDTSITQSYDSTSHKITVTVNSTQVDRTVYATINLPDGAEAKHIPTAYGGHFTYDNGKFVMAPPNNNAGQEFSYWEIKTLEDAFVANCYSQYFNYVGYDDYIVTAVYGQGKNTDIYDKSNTSTTVTFLEYSRNHWNDYDSENKPHPNGAPYGETGKEYDRLYADFALAFNYKGILLNETQVDGLKLGYVLDVTGNSTESELKTGILENQDKSSFKINNSNNVLNYSIKRTDLDNKNRIECYYGIKNTPANRSYNINVYSYMIVNDVVTLSEQPITICYNGAIKK